MSIFKKFKESRVFLLFIISGLFIFLGLDVNAQLSNNLTENNNGQREIIVANVEIYNAEIISQEKNNFNLSFDFFNKGQVQPDIRYAVQLSKNDELGNNLVDEEVYSESINLGSGEEFKKEINYIAPEYLSGEFNLRVIARTQNGLILALSNLGTINLSGEKQYVEISSPSCYLKVDGEPDDVRYEISKGIDIEINETVLVICDVLNHFDEEISFKPHFNLYKRTTLGEEIQLDENAQDIVTLDSGENDSFSFLLPKPDIPQAYDSRLALVDDGNKIISNEIIIHYVIRGISATIQNFKLDKSYYQAGDIINVSMFWSASADNFPGSRFDHTENKELLLDVLIKDENEEVCAIFDERLDIRNLVNDYKLTASRDCLNPEVVVKIKDSQNNVLDEKKYSIKSRSVDQSHDQIQVDDKRDIFWQMGLVAILFIMFILFVLILVKRKRNIGGITLFLLVGLFSLLMTNSTEAYSVYVGYDVCLIADDNGNCLQWVVHDYIKTVSINKSVYNPGETVFADTMLSDIHCSNSISPGYHKITVGNSSDDQNGGTGFSFAGGSASSSFNLNFATFHWHDKRCNDKNCQGEYSRDDTINFDVYGSCVGSIPSNSTMCVGDDTDLGVNNNVDRTTVSSCGAPKCEYTCDPGYYPANGRCYLFLNVSLNANPRTVDLEGSTELSFKVDNASSCEASGDWSGSKSVNGGSEMMTNLLSNKTYYLTCKDNYGHSVNRAASVCVRDGTYSCSYSLSPGGGDSCNSLTKNQQKRCDKGDSVDAIAVCRNSCGEIVDDCLCQDCFDHDCCETNPINSCSGSSCTDTPPPFYEDFGDDENTGIVDWHYSAIDTSALCEFGCPSSYGWDGSSCVLYSCLPSSIDNASICLGSNLGLIENTNSTTVESCTGSKCEFECKTGYKSSADNKSCNSVSTNSNNMSDWIEVKP